MSYKSQHMSVSINGVRGSVEVLNPFEALKGTTWFNFHDKHVSPQEYGNTLYNDLTVVSYTFKNRFNASRASVEIGYSLQHIGNGRYVPNANAVVIRLKRINSKDILDIARAMIQNDLMTMDDISHILSDPLKTGREACCNKNVVRSFIYKKYSYLIVESAIKRWKTKTAASNKLGVTVDVLDHWIEVGKEI